MNWIGGARYRVQQQQRQNNRPIHRFYPNRADRGGGGGGGRGGAGGGRGNNNGFNYRRNNFNGDGGPGPQIDSRRNNNIAARNYIQRLESKRPCPLLAFVKETLPQFGEGLALQLSHELELDKKRSDVEVIHSDETDESSENVNAMVLEEDDDFDDLDSTEERGIMDVVQDQVLSRGSISSPCASSPPRSIQSIACVEETETDSESFSSNPTWYTSNTSRTSPSSASGLAPPSVPSNPRWPSPMSVWSAEESFIRSSPSSSFVASPRWQRPAPAYLTSCPSPRWPSSISFARAPLTPRSISSASVLLPPGFASSPPLTSRWQSSVPSASPPASISSAWMSSIRRTEHSPSSSSYSYGID